MLINFNSHKTLQRLTVATSPKDVSFFFLQFRQMPETLRQVKQKKRDRSTKEKVNERKKKCYKMLIKKLFSRRVKEYRLCIYKIPIIILEIISKYRKGSHYAVHVAVKNKNNNICLSILQIL